VWLYGDQSPLTVPELCAAIARGIAFDEEDLMLDLGNASSIDDSVVEVIVLAREYLRQRSRSLAIRSVTPSACRVFVLCGLAELVVSDAGTYRLTQPMASRA
jgi:anti-anti-sigma regulatory factor